MAEQPRFAGQTIQIRKHCPGALSPAQFKILAICDQLHREGRPVFSTREIAELMGCTLHNVFGLLKGIVAAGFLVKRDGKHCLAFAGRFEVIPASQIGV